MPRRRRSRRGQRARDLARGGAAVAEARRWLGTPWHHQARLRGVGVDCIGLIVGVAEGLGIAAPDITDYGRRPDNVMLKRGLRRHMRRVSKIIPGDVLLFELDGVAQHVGIATDVGVIHAHAQSRKVVEHGLGHWAGMIAGVFRFPE